MPQPTRSQVHIDRPLTNISVAFQQNQSDYIAARVFPQVPVQKQSDQYFTYDKDQWFRTDAQVRAPSTESAGSGYTLNNDNYFAFPYALHKDIDDQLRANADSPINLEREATQFVTNQLLLKRDKDWATNYFGASIWTSDRTGVSAAPTGAQFLQWDQAGSDPIQDIQDEAIAQKVLTGLMPNTLVIGQEVYNVLRNHAAVTERIKYTRDTLNITPALLAQAFDVRRVLVASAVENTAAEGAAASMSFIYGKAGLLCYAAPNPGLMTASAGYIFSWTGLLGNAFGTTISRFRMDELKSDRVEGEMAYDMKVVAPDLGSFFATAIA